MSKKYYESLAQSHFDSGVKLSKLHFVKAMGDNHDKFYCAYMISWLTKMNYYSGYVNIVPNKHGQWDLIVKF